MGHQFKGLRHSGDPEVIPRVSSPHREANAGGLRWRMGNPSLKIHRGAILSRWRDSDGFYLHFFPLVLLHFPNTLTISAEGDMGAGTTGRPATVRLQWAWPRNSGLGLCAGLAFSALEVSREGKQQASGFRGKLWRPQGIRVPEGLGVAPSLPYCPSRHRSPASLHGSPS